MTRTLILGATGAGVILAIALKLASYGVQL